MRLVNFLGMTIIGSTVYFSLTAFLKMLCLSSQKLGTSFVFISFTLFLQNWSHCCSFLSTSKFNFSMLYIGIFCMTSARWTSSSMF